MNSAEVEWRRSGCTSVTHLFAATPHVVDAPSNDITNVAVHADEHGCAADERIASGTPRLRDFGYQLIARNVVRSDPVGESNGLDYDLMVRAAGSVQPERAQSRGIADDELTQSVRPPLYLSPGRLVEAVVGEPKPAEGKIGYSRVRQIWRSPLQRIFAQVADMVDRNIAPPKRLDERIAIAYGIVWHRVAIGGDHCTQIRSKSNVNWRTIVDRAYADLEEMFCNLLRRRCEQLYDFRREIGRISRPACSYDAK